MRRSEIFRAPAGSRKFELSSNKEQVHNSWIINRREYQQFCECIKRFKSEYPKATQWQVMLAERAFKSNIFIQRVEDRRCFFDGSETGAVRYDKFYLEIDDESSKRWQGEFDRLYWKFSKEIRDCLAMLMSEKIDLQITGSLSSLSDIFAKDDKARDELQREVKKRIGGETETTNRLN